MLGPHVQQAFGMGSLPPELTFLLNVGSRERFRRQIYIIALLQVENRMLKERPRGR